MTGYLERDRSSCRSKQHHQKREKREEVLVGKRVNEIQGSCIRLVVDGVVDIWGPGANARNFIAAVKWLYISSKPTKKDSTESS